MFWLDTAMFGETKVTKKQELIVEKQFGGLNTTGCLKLTGVCIFVETALRSNQLAFLGYGLSEKWVFAPTGH